MEVPHSTSTNLKENMRNFSLFILASFITLGSTLPQLKSSYRNYQTDRQRQRGTYDNVRNSQVVDRRRYDEEPKCRIEYDTVYDIEKEENYEQQCVTKYKCVIRNKLHMIPRYLILFYVLDQNVSSLLRKYVNLNKKENANQLMKNNANN